MHHRRGTARMRMRRVLPCRMMNEPEECFDSSHHWLARTDTITGSRVTERPMKLNSKQLKIHK